MQSRGWPDSSPAPQAAARVERAAAASALYTADERRRRDASRWTLVQGVLAPLQFVAFLISLVLVLRFLVSGEGLAAATVSVLVKTALLYTIMVTGSIWEREVFGVYLFARPFFWEDVVSLLVLALHTAYVAARGAQLEEKLRGVDHVGGVRREGEQQLRVHRPEIGH